jgi:mannose-6-phosphate isomerase-like protein (cupin superfamily)
MGENMVIRRLVDLEEMLAGDGSRLKEVIVPAKDRPGLGFSLAHAIVDSGQKTKRHTLGSDEIYVIIEGMGIIEIDGERQEVESGSIILIPKDAVQHIENTGEERLVFYCIVSPPWKEENEKMLD